LTTVQLNKIQPVKKTRTRLALGAIFGFPIGILAGLTGVGGGEYRTPVLLSLLGDVRVTIASNLLIGVVTSLFIFALRQSQNSVFGYLSLALILAIASIPGSYFGAVLTRTFSDRILKTLLASILVAAAVRLLFFTTPVRPSFELTFGNLFLGIFFGFMLGIVSGLLGVAAGEYRIPVLIVMFAVPVKIAGTLNALVSIPSQATGYWKHRRLGHYEKTATRLTLFMAIASVVGVAVGVAYLATAENALVTTVLGIAMILVAAKLALEAVKSPISHRNVTFRSVTN
jgi:uncharacterized membrane protein YfcA